MSSAVSRLCRSAVPIVSLLLVTSACGTRVGRDDTRATAAVPSQSAVDSSGQSAGAVTTELAAVGAGNTATDQSATTPGTTPQVRQTQPAGTAQQAATSRTTAAGPAVGAGTNPSGGTQGTGDPTPNPAPGGPPTRPGGPVPPVETATKSPLVLASVGTYSGPVGAVLSAILYGAQTWVRSINAKGGLNGHPIQLIVFDDGGDPARHRAQIQQAIEQKKAQALFANAEVFTGESSVQYVNEKRIPIIGSDTGEAWAYYSPMYFMQAPSGNYLVYTMLTTAAKIQVPLGKTKLGLLACAEVVSCQKADEIRGKHAARLGFQSVYSGKASIAQPDFTAECLAARNAGTETFVVVMDANSLGRVAAACTRQGFKPTYVNVAGNLLDSLAKNPDFEGLLGNSNVAPFFQTGTPATDEFQKAVKAYGQKAAMGVGVITGWAAGKLLERAGAQLPEPPTTEALLRGLWSIKNDNLGGLSAQPLTFAENQPPVGMACWYAVQVKKGVWTSPDGFTANCDSTHID